MNFRKLYQQFLVWKTNNVTQSHLLTFMSFLIGILTALVAWVLKTLIHFIQHLLTANIISDDKSYLYLIYPGVGILLAGLFVKFVVKDDISHGITKVLYAISQRKSFIKLHNVWSSIVASSITIGFGGSVGAEAPIVLTGSAVGSSLGRFFKVEQRYLMLLIGCGAAGAIAGTFKAPIAGLIFVVEVLMLDLTLFTVLPLIVSSVTAATFSYITTGTQPMFEFSHGNQFAMERIPYVILLGIFCGLVSLYFTRSMYWAEGKFKKLTYRKKFFLGASVLSVLIFLLPPLYGEGYDTINALINGSYNYESLLAGSPFYGLRNQTWSIVIFLGAVMLMKVFATSATNGGGGTGGTFAPSLFVGCVAGFVFAFTINKLDSTYDIPLLPHDNFALMGMAGVLAGVMHAPLTGTFLIAELTGGYELFLPLLIVCSVSFATIRIFESHSLYSMRLAQKGELVTHEKDRAILTLMNNHEDILETDFQCVTPDMNLGDVVKIISTSSRNTFPVVDSENRFMGVVLLDNIRNLIFRPELYSRFKVTRFMTAPPAIVVTNMTMNDVMGLFDKTKAWNLPVVGENDIYKGFVSKSSILNLYREVLVENFSED